MRRTAALVVLMVGTFGRASAADSLNCRLVGSLDLDYGSGVALSGNYAYVSDGYGSLYILDVSDPTAPHEVGRFDTTDMSRSVAVSGDFAYLTAYGSFDGLWIINVSDPQEPHAVGRYSSPCRVVGDFVLSVGFDYGYMPAGYRGLRILDMTDPQEPYEVGHWEGLGKTCGVALSGKLAYVTDNDSGLQILDVSNPKAPYEVGRCSLPGNTLSVSVSGDFAYVGGGDLFGKLRVIDVSDPREPREVAWVGFRDLGAAVAVSGNLAYVVDWEGLYVADVSDPHSPHLAGWYEGLKVANDVAVSGNLAYMPGLEIVEFLGEGVEETPNAVVRASEFGSTVVRGTLRLPPASGVERRASCVLLDVTGRKVRDLHPGVNDVRALAPGVYFVREAQAQAQAVRKVVIAR